MAIETTAQGEMVRSVNLCQNGKKLQVQSAKTRCYAVVDEFAWMLLLSVPIAAGTREHGDTRRKGLIWRMSEGAVLLELSSMSQREWQSELSCALSPCKPCLITKQHLIPQRSNAPSHNPITKTIRTTLAVGVKVFHSIYRSSLIRPWRSRKREQALNGHSDFASVSREQSDFGEY